MYNNNVYTNLLIKINELSKKELTPFVLDEMKILYHALVSKKFLELDDAKANGYQFLINELSSTLFDMIRRKNNISINDTIRKATKILEFDRIFIDDIVCVRNHAFAVGRQGINFEQKEKAYLVNDNLKEINDIRFINYMENSKYSYSMIQKAMQMVVDAINDALSKLDLIDKSTYPYLFINNNKIGYEIGGLHLYISDDLMLVCDDLTRVNKESLEIVVEDHAKNYYILLMDVSPKGINVHEVNNYLWKLSDEKEKVIRKSKV